MTHEHHGHECGCHECNEHHEGCSHEHHDCCGHDHASHDANGFVENSLVLSRSWTRENAPPAAAAELERRTANGLRSIAELLASDGAILGHLKARLSCGEGAAVLSITRLDTVDVTYTGKWTADLPVSSWTLNVNIISIANTDALDGRELEEFF